MINMKTSDKKMATMLAESESDEPEYPYGLRISLDDDSLKKLGITEMPDVGKPLEIRARVEVVSVSQYEHSKGKSRDMSLQITDMSLGIVKEESTAQTLYPNSDMN